MLLHGTAVVRLSLGGHPLVVTHLAVHSYVVLGISPLKRYGAVALLIGVLHDPPSSRYFNFIEEHPLSFQFKVAEVSVILSE